MYKIIFLSLFVCFSFSARSQSIAHNVALHIAQKMKDSLDLSVNQKGQLYGVNMQLYNKKTLARKKYAGSDSVRISIQKIENTRDSLYKNILATDKYLLYKQKKLNLISNN